MLKYLTTTKIFRKQNQVSTLFSVAGALVILSLLVPDQVHAQRVLRMQAVFPSSLSVLGGAGVRFADQVGKKTNGQIRVRYYEPGEIVGALETLEAVVDRRIDMAFTTAGYYTDDNPALTFFAAVPFGATGLTKYQWVRSGEGRRLFDQIHTRLGVKALPCLLLTPEGGGWFREPIQQVSDFNNLKIRFFGFGARVVEKLGAQPVLLAGSEIVPALRAGVIDATEFSTPDLDQVMGFEQIVDHYYYPGWHQKDSIGVVYINPRVWRQLGAKRQATIEKVCHDNILHWHRESQRLDRVALRGFRDRGVRPKQFPAPVLAALQEQWNTIAAEDAVDNSDFRRVWRAYRKFLDTRSEDFRARTTRTRVQRTHPDALGFYTNRGRVIARLRSTGNADHRLTLQKQNANNGRWTTVARSSAVGASESIRYVARPGFYRWVVNTDTAAGRYTLKTKFK